MSPRATDHTKRTAILDAALELFVERGFHGTAVPELARRAGVGAGTIYRHFKGKEQLVNELYRMWKLKLADELLTDFPFADPPRRQFAAYWERYTRFASAHPRAQAFMDLHHHADYLDDESRAVAERLERTAMAVVERMQTQGVVKALPPVLLMALVLGSLIGLFRAVWFGHLELTPEVVEAAERCCWEAIRA